MTGWIIAALSSLGLLFFLKRQYGKADLKKSKRFEARSTEAVEKSYTEQFSSYDKDAFTEIWNNLARLLDISPEKMRSEDRFDVEFAPEDGAHDEKATDYLGELYWKKCRSIGLKIESGFPFQTVGQFVHFLLR